MAYQIIDNEAVTEPVTLAEQKAFSNIDADYSIPDADLEMFISAARIRLEQYLNIGLAKRSITVQWDGRLLQLPLSPTGTIASVKKNDEADPLAADTYTVNGYQAKSIVINSLSSLGYSYFYNLINGTVDIDILGSAEVCDMYTVVYETGYETLPAGLKTAIKAEADFLEKLKGEPITTLVSPNAKFLAAGYSRNLVL